jgi:hypothetical protein
MSSERRKAVTLLLLIVGAVSLVLGLALAAGLLN